MKKRITALILALIFISAELLMVSCQETPGNKPAQTNQPDESTVAVTEPAVTERLYPDVPEDLDFKNEPITFLVIGDGYNGADWKSRDIYQEEDSADPIEAAVFRRNSILEEKYHVKIEEVAVNDTSGTARKAINSGTDEYQVLMCDTKGTLSLASAKMLLDLNELNGINVNSPWWDRSIVKDCSIGGKNFFLTGDISVMDNDATWVLMFNKSLRTKYDLEDPYELVRNNQWTYDKMLEMMTAVAGNGQGDLNGNSKVDYDEDQFGFVTHNSSLGALYYAAGLRVIEKDESDMPCFSEKNTELVQSVLEKSIKLWSDKAITWSADRDGYGAVELQEIFEEGRGLFLGEVMQLVFRLRSMEIDFGLIPFPKFTPEQKNYGHFVHSTTALLSIPTTCKNSEAVAYFVEAMACESMYTLTPAYYETALTGSYFRDPESAEMLDIILASRSFDLGSIHMYDWGNIGSIFTSLLSNGSTAYASQYQRKIGSAKKRLEKDLAKLLN